MIYFFYSSINYDYSKILHAGEENLKHYEAYEEALKSGSKLTLRYIKFLFLGPPRSGKSSTRRRLLKEIVNLSSLGGQSISTGLAETNEVVIKPLTNEPATISGCQWSSIKGASQGDLNYFAHLMYSLISRSKSNTVPAAVNEPHSHDSGRESDQIPINFKAESEDELSSTPLSESEKKEVDQAFKNLTSVLQSDNPEDLRLFLENLTLVNNVDIGGQPAFLELCPTFTTGPALYLIFFRLDQELRKKYEIKFIDADKKETMLESSYCTETVIHQLLSCSACFGSHSTNESATTSKIPSRALLFGTFADQVNSEDIDNADANLRQQLLNTELQKQGLLLRTSKNKFFFSVDNMHGDESEVSPIREDIEGIIRKHFPAVSIPASWLMFRIILHYMRKPVVSIAQCEEIAKHISMVTPVQEAIWFFHQNIGSLMYYPDIPSLKNVVICNLQIIFDSTNELIIDTFKIRNRAIPPSAVDDFHNKGQFSLAHIKDRTEHHRNNKLSLEQLVDLLKHHNILAEIKDYQKNSGETEHHQEWAIETDQSQTKFIMPAVLKSASEEELIVTPSTTSDETPLPLIIHFKNGFVPFGVFCASTANLIARQDSMSPTWRLCDNQIMKNKVTFTVGNAFIATLISRPQHIEVHVEGNSKVRNPNQYSLSYICSTVRETFVQTLETVVSKMKYKFFPKVETPLSSSKELFDLAFTCSLDDSHNDHLMKVTNLKEEGKRILVCLKDERELDLEDCHLMWFPEVLMCCFC